MNIFYSARTSLIYYRILKSFESVTVSEHDIEKYVKKKSIIDILSITRS